MFFASLVLATFKPMTKKEIPIWLIWTVYSGIAVTFIVGKIGAIINNLMIIVLS
jgi:hypothetical protein